MNNPTEPRQEVYARTVLGRLDRATERRPWTRTSLIILLAALLIVPSVQFMIRIHEVESSAFREAGEKHRTALGRWIPTAAMLSDPQHDDPYGSGHWFPLPPFVLMLLEPLSRLGYGGASIVWVVLKLGGLIAGVGLMLRGLDREGFTPIYGVAALTLAFGLRPVIGDLQHGNVNIFVLVWLALAWAAYVNRRDFLAGALVSLAIVTKITPGLALMYFAYKRAWRVCLGAIIGLVVVFFLVPSLRFGVENGIALHQSWFDMLIRPYLENGYTVLDIANQSLYSVVLRWCDDLGLVTLQTMSMADAESAGVIGMARPTGAAQYFLRPAISVAILGTLVLSCRTPTTRQSDIRLLLEFGMIVTAMLLLSERTWKHHATPLFISYLGIWSALAFLNWRKTTGNFMVFLLGVQWVLLVGTSSGLWGDRLADRLLHYGAVCWSLLLCFAQGAFMLFILNRPKATPESP